MSDDGTKAMLFRYPRYIPVYVGIVPATWMKYREQLDALIARHPILYGPSPEKHNYEELWSPTYAVGEYLDDWGCLWRNVHHGMDGMVIRHPLPNREDIRNLKPPAQVRDGFEHGFMFQRLLDLRGFEEAMLDFAEEPPELQQLIDIVLAHNLQKLDKLLATLTTPGQVIWFGDDLGMQTSLMISPKKWRKYLKPCYATLYSRVHQAGHYVLMHSDGCIFEIIPDLVECGVDTINPQFRANGLENLVRVAKGKVCVAISLDEQLFPFATPQQIDDHVREVVAALGAPEGGLSLYAEVGPDVPLENIDAIMTAFEKYRGFFCEPQAK